MRSRARLITAMTACLTLASQLAAQDVRPAWRGDISQLDSQVLQALNAARSDPATYAAGLRTYRGFFHANIVVMPGQAVDYETQEGVAPVDESIAFLGQQPSLESLGTGNVLALAAADHVREQSANGRTGHYSADGGTPSDRVMRHGGGGQVAEVIAYGAVDAADVVRQLIVDDGVADRGHRKVIFSGHLRYAGVACGAHPEFGTMCVIDMADTPDGRPGGPLRRVQVAAVDETGHRHR